MIPFNKSTPVGREIEFVTEAIKSGQTAGNGPYSKKCISFFEQRYGFKKCLLTTSCTDALEMSAVLLNLRPGDEVIVPAFTFVSTANAFKLHGAKIVFADSKVNSPNIDPEDIKRKITSRTRAICIVHYAGVACDMDEILNICRDNNITLIEDAAQAIESFYKGKPLGSFGDFATFSFHETKNISSGEGGMLVVNNSEYFERSEIIWEKGTNRAAFKRGDVQKYECVDVGASYLMSELNAAFLFGQLEKIEEITSRRREVCKRYQELLSQDPRYRNNLGEIGNGHIFHILSVNRNKIIKDLKSNGINASFHYLSLETSPYYNQQLTCYNAKKYENEILRLPVYYSITNKDIETVVNNIVAID